MSEPHGAFASISEFDTFPVDPCVCPGSPHETDSITYRKDFGMADVVAVSRASARFEVQGGQEGGKPSVTAIIDPFSTQLALLAVGITGWTFVDEEGAPVPLVRANVERLRESIAEPLVAILDEVYQRSRARLPNSSGARSRKSSPGAGATARPATPRKRTRRG